jgi:HAD superfamily hydrolase (TIGR01549 family)
VPKAVILDVDGTLVDSNYQHVLAWQRAFGEHDLTVPAARLHQHVGIGSDKYVAAVTDDRVEERLGDAVRDSHERFYEELIDEVPALDGARDLLVELQHRERCVILSSSASESELEHYLDLLDARELIDGATHAGSVESTKPAPDLIEAALEQAGTRDAVMVGDSVWDCKAASPAGIAVLGVRSGGFCAADLREAGAMLVYEGPRELCEQLDEALESVRTSDAGIG